MSRKKYTGLYGLLIFYISIVVVTTSLCLYCSIAYSFIEPSIIWVVIITIPCTISIIIWYKNEKKKIDKENEKDNKYYEEYYDEDYEMVEFVICNIAEAS